MFNEPGGSTSVLPVRCIVFREIIGEIVCSVLVVVSLQRVGRRGVHCEVGAGDTISFRCPGAKVGHLTSFRAERAPGIAFPDAGLAAERTDHARHYTMVNTGMGQRLTRADLAHGGDLQQSL
jgi:hypothetical protein